MKSIFSLIMLLSISMITYAQMDIATAKQQSIGSTVTVRGIVLNGDELGTIRYVQDNTGGIAAYSFSLSALVPGDSVEITGELKDYNNLLEIDPVTSHTVISSGNSLPAPTVVSLSAGYQEQYEGMLMQFNGVEFVGAGVNFQGVSANYDITDGNTTAQIRVNGTTNLVGSPVPQSSINIVGVMSQYQSTYQLLPRSTDDLKQSGPILTTQLMQDNIAKTSFDVSFETQNQGSTIVRYGTTDALGMQVSDAALTTSHSVSLTGLSAGTIYFVQGLSVSSGGDTSLSAIQLMATESESKGWMRPFFNHPVDLSVSSGTNAQYVNDAFADTLKNYINQARFTIDIAIYNIDNDNGLIDALNAAYQNGRTIRYIGDYDQQGSVAWNTLNIGAGNKKVSPSGSAPSGGFYGIMHNKFLVIDANSANPNHPIVITGSTNFTDGQLNDDPNNMIAIQDQSLAKAYTLEFNEMWAGDYGPEKVDNTPHEFVIGGSRVECYFSPSDDTEAKMKNTIQSADHELYFALYIWTRWGVALEIEDVIQNAGVQVAGIVQDTAGGSQAYNYLIDDMGSNYILDQTPGIFHHKYMIVDPHFTGSDPLVWTGSHNWSTSAQSRNDENTLVIHDATVANQYFQEWKQRWLDNGGNATVDVEDLMANDLQVIIYPNPAGDMAMIRYELTESADVQLELIDLTGRTIQAYDYTVEAGNYVTTLDIADLTSGIYLVRQTIDGQQKTTRLVVE